MKKFLKYFLITVVALVFILGLSMWGLYLSADTKQPDVSVDLSKYPVVDSLSYKSCNGSMIRQSSSGLWEMYLQGTPLERGVAFGKLAEPLLYYQEKVFVDQIKEIVPSEGYLKFLKFFIGIFNRNIGQYIPEEYRTEIYGLSLSCTHEYDYIGTPYDRQLNYHAAHDIGHTMQEYMLVGCSSFSTWGAKSKDSSLVVGRNFDFFVGDDFAKNKLISFINPSKGYKFASVGWAGMVGVLSGMNEAGLTVTLNAAKGTMPTSSAMPISLLAREILQYASTIDEAYTIAKKYKTFVSESLLIGSAKDGCAAIIEKTPDKIGLYRSGSNQIICTNHYQGDTFKNDEDNQNNIKNSDSPYRYKRLEQLLAKYPQVDENAAAAILRNRFGNDGKDIGLTNEKSINQSICHHSVIFKPKEQLMWVSTSPWQSGQYVCYNLKEIFAKCNFGGELAEKKMAIAADCVFLKDNYAQVVEFRHLAKYIKKSIRTGSRVAADSLQKLKVVNPNFFYTYDLIGDYYNAQGNVSSAKAFWTKALTLEIPRMGERNQITKKIKEQSND